MKHLKSFAAIIALAVAFTSCTVKEVMPQQPQGPTHTVVFSTGVPETKTEMSIDGNKVSFTWSDDDLDRLIIKEDGVPGTIDKTKSTISANELVVYATFPGEASEEQKTYTAVLGGTVGDQTPREDSYDKAADILLAKPVVATAAQAIKFQFGRPVAINKMTLCDLPAGETLNSVKVSSDKDIAGTVGEDGWENPATELTLTVGRTIPENGEFVLYYTSVPAEDATLTVEATVGTDSYKKAFGNTLTTTAGNVKGYSVGLKKQAHMVLTENFSSSKATTDNYNCGSNITNADNRTDFDYVWSQSGSGTVFKNGIKLGGSDKTGSVSNETMIADFAAGTKFYVKVYAAVWNTDGGKIKVTYNEDSSTKDAANDAITSTSSAYSGDDFKKSTDFEFVKVEGENTITIESTIKRILIDKVEVVYDGDAPKLAQTISFAKSSKTITLGAEFEINGTYEIQAASLDEGDGTVTYAVTEGDDVVSVNSEDGKVTIKQAGTATITATAAETDTYKSASDSYTLTINEAGSSNPVTETLTIADFADANSWINSQAYNTASTANVKFTASGTGNNCKYYESDESWRFYSSGDGKITITVPEGKKITQVKLTGTSYFLSAPTGWSYSDKTFTPKEETTTNTVTIANGSGTSKITAIAVTFQ